MAVPNAPSNLTITTDAVNGVNLAWHDNSSNETSFYLYRSIDGGAFSQIDTLSANQTTYQSNDLNNDGTNYAYKISAHNSSGNSAYSNTVNTTVTLAPTTPIEFSISILDNIISTTWDNEDFFGVQWYLYRSTNGIDYTLYQTLPDDSSFDDMVGAGTYYYKVTAFNDYGESDPTEILSETFTPPSLSAPTDLIGSVNTNDISLSWVNNANIQTGFNVYRSTNGIDYTLLNTTTVTRYSDIVTALGTYYYKVTAFNETNESDPSNVINKTVVLLSQTPSTNIINSTIKIEGGTSASVFMQQINNNFESLRQQNNTNLDYFIALGIIPNLANNKIDNNLIQFPNGNTLTADDLNVNFNKFKFTEINQLGHSIPFSLALFNNGTKLNPDDLNQNFSRLSKVINQQSETLLGFDYAHNYIGAPTYLSVVYDSEDGNNVKLNLSWQDNANNETGYVVIQSIDGVDYTLASILPPNSASCSVYFPVGTDSKYYFYRVYAVNNMSTSYLSNIAYYFYNPENKSKKTPKQPPNVTIKIPITAMMSYDTSLGGDTVVFSMTGLTGIVSDGNPAGRGIISWGENDTISWEVLQDGVNTHTYSTSGIKTILINSNNNIIETADFRLVPSGKTAGDASGWVEISLQNQAGKSINAFHIGSSDMDTDIKNSNLIYFNCDTSHNMTDMSNKFANCTSLLTANYPFGVHILNAEKMYYNCTSMQNIIMNDQTTSCTNFISTFEGCTSLAYVDWFSDSETTAQALTTARMYYECNNFLQNRAKTNTSQIDINVNSSIDCTEMFYGCSSMLHASVNDFLFFTLGSSRALTGMFSGCSSMIDFKPNGGDDFGLVAGGTLYSDITFDLTDMFYGCTALTDGVMLGTQSDVDYSHCPALTESAIVDIFNNLYHLSGGSNEINIAGCLGQPDLTGNEYMIARDKGWYVYPSYVVKKPTNLVGVLDRVESGIQFTKFTWTNNAEGVTEFRLYYRALPYFDWNDGNYFTIKAPALEYFQGHDNTVTFSWRVRAVTPYGESDYSNIVTTPPV